MVDEAQPEEILAIVGLGNPGRRYEANRHNFGCMVVDRLAFLKKEEFIKGNGPFVYCPIKTEHNELKLCKSTTFMNNTGRATVRILDQFDIKAENLLVVSDDYNLPLGKIRYRKRGSDGGHKGLASIIKHLQTGDFPRLRLGIASDQLDYPLEDYVLEDFTDDELTVINKVIPVAADFVLDLAAKISEKSSITLTVTEGLKNK